MSQPPLFADNFRGVLCVTCLKLYHVTVGTLVHDQLHLLILHGLGQGHRLVGERLGDDLGKGRILPDASKL